MGISISHNNTFESLETWQHSQDLAVSIYQHTKTYPKDEIFGITSQIRRSAASISANIAEGYGRSSIKDKLHFMSIAYGSLLETKNFIYLSQRLEYLDDSSTKSLLEKCTTCQKLINGYRKSLNK